MHATEQTRCDQLELDLFERAAIKLLGDLDLEATLSGRSDDRIGLVQIMRDGRLVTLTMPMCGAVSRTS
jgi:hypothetical protein